MAELNKNFLVKNNNYNYLNANLALFGRVTYRLPIGDGKARDILLCGEYVVLIFDFKYRGCGVIVEKARIPA